MKHADAALADEQIVGAVYDALAKRHPKSRSRGRYGAPTEVVLRLLVLKHVRNWSYAALEREVRANLVMRKCPTPRPWVAGAWRWGGRCSGRSTTGW